MKNPSISAHSISQNMANAKSMCDCVLDSHKKSPLQSLGVGFRFVRLIRPFLATRRHLAGSLGGREEFSAQAEQARSSTGRSGQSYRELLLARKGEGKESKLSYSGNLLVESQRTDRWRGSVSGERDGGTRCRVDHVGEASGYMAGDGGWG
jgi:hypothetical protein